MSTPVDVRESARDDSAEIELLYPAAFPEEDLLPLVRDLLREEAVTLSLVGIADSKLVGHVIFTYCGLFGNAGHAALLGPLAVMPAWQKQGIGKTLVHAGFQRLQEASVTQVYVLGDPAYYGRFGFSPESRVSPPYPLPPEWDGAWQSKCLGAATESGHGELCLPQLWLKPALWLPPE